MVQVKPTPARAEPVVQPPAPEDLIDRTLLRLQSTSSREEAREVLAKAFIASTAIPLIECTQWALDGVEPRYHGKNFQGDLVVIVGQLPQEGTLVEFGGVRYYIWSHAGSPEKSSEEGGSE